MNPTWNTLESAAQAVLPALLNSLWQGALIALVVWIGLKLLRRINAATAGLVWWAALAAVVTLPFLNGWRPEPAASGAERRSPDRHVSPSATLPADLEIGAPLSVERNEFTASRPVTLPLPAGEGRGEGERVQSTLRVTTLEQPSTTAPAPAPHKKASLEMPLVSDRTASSPVVASAIPVRQTMRWEITAAPVAVPVLVMWISVAVLLLARLAFSWRKLVQLKRAATPAAEARQQRFEILRAQVGLRRVARLGVSDRVHTPLAAGLRQPMVLLPAKLAGELTDAEFDAVAVHELAHLRRWDDWTNLLQQTVQAVFWLNPVVWFMGRQIALHREIACDDWVIAATGQPKDYATCLTRLMELARPPRLSLPAPGAWMTRGQLTRRVMALLDKRRNAAPRGSLGWTAFSLALMALLVAAALRWGPTIALAAEPAAPKALQVQAPKPSSPPIDPRDRTLPGVPALYTTPQPTPPPAGSIILKQPMLRFLSVHKDSDILLKGLNEAARSFESNGDPIDGLLAGALTGVRVPSGFTIMQVEDNSHTERFLLVATEEDPRYVNLGRHVVQVESSRNPTTGQSEIRFQMDETGADKLEQLTRANLHRPLAIMFHGRLVSAPTFQIPLIGGKGVITGRFTDSESYSLASMLLAYATGTGLPPKIEAAAQDNASLAQPRIKPVIPLNKLTPVPKVGNNLATNVASGFTFEGFNLRGEMIEALFKTQEPGGGVALRALRVGNKLGELELVAVNKESDTVKLRGAGQEIVITGTGGRPQRVAITDYTETRTSASALPTASGTQGLQATTILAKQEERDLVLEEIALVEQLVETLDKQFKLGRASQEEVIKAKRDLIALKRQLAVLEDEVEQAAARAKLADPSAFQQRLRDLVARAAEPQTEADRAETAKREAEEKQRKQELLKLLLATARTDTNQNVRTTAISAIGRLKLAESIEPLLKLGLNEKDQRVSQIALHSIAQFPGEDATKALLVGYEHFSGNQQTRYMIVGLLTERSDPLTRETLRKISQDDPDPQCRGIAIQALVRPPDPARVPSREDTSSSFQQRVAEILAQQEQLNAEALAAQEARLPENSEVRRQKAEVEAKVKAAGEARRAEQALATAEAKRKQAEVVQRLAEVAKADSDPKVRLSAVGSIAANQSDEAVDLLAHLAVHDPDAGVRQSAFARLSNLQTSAATQAKLKLLEIWKEPEIRRAVVSVLTEYVTKPSGDGRTEFVRMLVTPELAVDVLKTIALKDEDAATRRTAIFKLRGVREDVGLQTLLALYEAIKDNELRKSVIEVLGSRTEEAAKTRLLEIAKSDPDPACRIAALEALGGGRSQFQPGAPAMPGMLGGPSPAPVPVPVPPAPPKPAP